MRKWIGVGLVSVAVIAGGLWAHAQVQLPNGPRPAPGEVRQPPQIISGADIGFRVDGVAPDGKPVGRLVVHQRGEWVEVTLAGTGVRRLTAN
jgi:hypothetical protein